MPVECKEPSLWLDVARLAIPSLLVIFGWLIAYFVQRDHAAKQDTRKDLRNHLDNLASSLSSLRSDCFSYYTDVSLGAEREWAILVQIDDIRRAHEILCCSLVPDTAKADFTSQLSKVMMSATGDSFQTKSRKALSAHDHQLLKLRMAVNGLIDRFESAFAEKYPPKLPKKSKHT